MHHNYRSAFTVDVYFDGKKTAGISSRRRFYGFLFPWSDSSGASRFSYGIESALSDIISIDNERKPPMKGDELLNYLVNKIVDNNLHHLYELSAYSYQREIEELQSDFEVQSFEEVQYRGRYIWNEPKVIKVRLKHALMKANVNLNFMATVQKGKMYSRDSIKTEYATIVKRIQSINFIMDFLERNPQAVLDIYYFNNAGINEYNIESVNKNPASWAKFDKYVENLKWYEKNNIAMTFDKDHAIKVAQQNDCGCNFRFEKSFMAEAIFFELTDDRRNAVWFLLPDDTVLLYIMQGEKVLDFHYSEFGNMAGLQYPCALFDLNGQRIKK